MQTTSTPRRRLLPAAALLALAVAPPAFAAGYTIRSLNAPVPNMIPTDGVAAAVRVTVSAPSAADALRLALLLNGRDVTSALQPDGNATLTGFVKGLVIGDNVLQVHDSKASRTVQARLVVARAVPPATTCTSLGGTGVQAALLGEPSGGATVTSATLVAATATLAEYCRLLVDVLPATQGAPTTKVQVNLPTAWNGKKLQLGGGGFNGTLVTGLNAPQNEPPDSLLPITRGFMTAGTDSGHQTATGVDAQAFALDDEALRNFAFASYKNTHDVARQLALRYYGRPHTKSFYNGGSEGGREGMTMVQRYPNDFDAVFSNDPVMNFTALQITGNGVAMRAARPGGAMNVAKLQLTMDAVLAACDAIDGIADKVVAAFEACRAGPGPAAVQALRCASGGDDGNGCLSDNQIATVLYSKTGERFAFPLANGMTGYAGWEYGQENASGASGWFLGNITSFGSGFVRYFVGQSASFDPLAFNPNDHQARVQAVSAIMDATNPDITPFLARGGKLIVKEDMADAAQGPMTGLDYARRVIATVSPALVEGGFRAYAMPGLTHTSSGIAAGTANAPSYGVPGRLSWLDVMTDWSDNGIAPDDRLVMVNKQATAPFAVLASRPLCRYPTFSYARYVGVDASGGADASNYVCVAPVAGISRKQ